MSESGRWSRSGIFSESQESAVVANESSASDCPDASKSTDEHYCQVCNKNLPTAYNLNVHEKWHSWSKVLQRRTLFKTPPIEDLGPPLATHYNSYDVYEASTASASDSLDTPRSRRLKCNMCGEVFTNRSIWAQHILEDHGNVSRKSRMKEEDDETEDDYEEYDESMEEEEEEEELDEQVVRQNGGKSDTAETPTIKVESQDDLPFCQECDMKFLNKRGFNTHMSRKHGRRPDGSTIGRSSSRYKRPSDADQDYVDGEDEEEEDEDEYAEDEDEEEEEEEPDEAEIGDEMDEDQIGMSPSMVIPDSMHHTMLHDTTDSLNLAAGAAEGSVDIYPCKFCKDRVFLTSFGLERHTKLTHPDNFKDVLEYIETLHRDREPPSNVKPMVTHAPGRGRKGVAFAKKIDALLAKEQTPKSPGSGDEFDFTYPTVGDRDMYADTMSDEDEYGRSKFRQPSHMASTKKEDGSVEPTEEDSPMELYHQPPLQAFRQHKAAIVAAASFTDSRGHGRPRRSVEAQRAKYQSCDTCGILINTENPKALEIHDRAHKKNRELKEELLRLYGMAWVERVTCKECNLVFKDDEKLDQHRRNVHVRRRHFLCRFCGDVFRNMRDLNMHKERRHEAFEGHRRGADPSVFNYNVLSSFYKRSYEDRRVMESGSFPEVWVTPVENKCPLCEDSTHENVRELVKHIFSVHGDMPEPLIVKSKDYAPFMCDFHDGIITWACCDLCTTDMTEMLNHRQLMHGTSITGRPQTCEYCSTVLTHRRAYDNHVRMHRFRQCKICQVWFDSTKLGFLAYRTHMRDHRDHGHEIKEVQVNDIRSRETELLDAITEEEQWGISEDEYSIFTESGVESDVEDEDTQEMLTTCATCGLVSSCADRAAMHAKLHTNATRICTGLQLKTKPYAHTTKAKYLCGLCGKSFCSLGVRGKHYMNCVQRRRGFIVPTVTVEEVVEKKVDETSTTVPEEELTGIENLPDASLPSDHLHATPSQLIMEDQLELSPEQKQKLPVEQMSFFLFQPVVDENDPEVRGFECPTCKCISETSSEALRHWRKTHSSPDEEENFDPETDSPKKKKPKRDVQEKSIEEQVESLSHAVALVPLNERVDNCLAYRYGCQQCFEKFEDQEELDEHMLRHEKRKEFRCKMCRKRYWTLEGLTDHFKIHDVNHLYCQTCFVKFNSVESLKRHEIFHELSNSLYQCEDCTMSYCGFAQLQAHFKEAHKGISILTCPICAQIHTDRNTLTQHLIQEHPKLNTKCTVCDRVYSCPWLTRCHARRAHMLRSDKETCYACGKVFRDKRSLIIHRWRHLGQLNWQCVVCDQSFADNQSVLDHLRSVHALDAQPSMVVNHECMGGAESTLPTTLSQMESATDDPLVTQTRLRCAFCFKRFVDRPAALRHLYRHHGFARHLQCQFCERVFCKSTARHSHMMRAHREEMDEIDAVKHAQDEGVDQDQSADGAGTSEAQPVYIRLGEDQQILEHFVAGEGGSDMQPYELLLLNGEEGLQSDLDPSQIRYVELPPGTDISQFKIAEDQNIQVIQMDQGEYARYVSQ